MLTLWKAEQKVIRQHFTMYQSIIKFSLEKMGLEVIIKHNKEDDDNILDDINDKLISVCWEYLQENHLGLDKFQLATIVMQLYSTAVSSLEAPYKIIAKESKALVKEYLEENAKKRQTLEKIIKENEELDKQADLLMSEQSKKKSKIKEVNDWDEVAIKTPKQKKKVEEKKDVSQSYNFTTEFTF